MYPEKPRELDSFWPIKGDDQMPYSVYRTPLSRTKWATPSEEPKFLADTQAGRPNRYGPDDITYSYNEYGFRTMRFSEISHEEPNRIVLSVGCSNTEGIGLPDHHTWPYLLTERFAKKDENRNFFNLNLGMGGSSNRHIALRAIRAMRELKPNYVNVAWTYPHRLHYAYEDGELVDWWAPDRADAMSASDKTKIKQLYFSHVQSDPYDLHNLATDIQMVSLAAELYGIPLCHSFLYLNHDTQSWLEKRFSDGLFGWYHWSPTARDLMHPGVDYNQWIALQMSRWWEKRK